MKKSNLASISKIESAGMLDGPGIRTVIFFSGCALRCQYCHNPEMWKKTDETYSVDDIFKLVIKNKPYFKNGGGVTFSGGDPLLHKDFIVELSKRLKKEDIHLALDTSGVGEKDVDELLSLMDLVLMDVKHVTSDGFTNLTNGNINDTYYFWNKLKKSNNKLWVRQVILPGITDSKEYLSELKKFVKDIPNVEKLEFIPYHTLGVTKYDNLGIDYPLRNLLAMDQEECARLYNMYLEI